MKNHVSDYDYIPWYFDKIVKVIIENGITSIGKSAFRGTSLTSITIPDSVTYIGSYAFKDCTGLTDVYYTGTEEEWNNIDIGYGNNYLKNATIYYNSTGAPLCLHQLRQL